MVNCKFIRTRRCDTTITIITVSPKSAIIVLRKLLKIAAIISPKNINCFYQHQLVSNNANSIQKTKNLMLL